MTVTAPGPVCAKPRLSVSGEAIERGHGERTHPAARGMPGAGDDVQLGGRPHLRELPCDIGRAAEVELPVDQCRGDVGDAGDSAK